MKILREKKSKILKIFKIENFDSRFKLIVADRDQNCGGHSKYRSSSMITSIWSYWTSEKIYVLNRSEN